MSTDEARWLIASLLIVGTVALLGWWSALVLYLDRNRQRRSKIAWKRDYYRLRDEETVAFDDVIRDLEEADIAPSHVLDWMRAHSASSTASKGGE